MIAIHLQFISTRRIGNHKRHFKKIEMKEERLANYNHGSIQSVLDI